MEYIKSLSSILAILLLLVIATKFYIKTKKSCIPNDELYYRVIGMSHFILYDKFALKYRMKIQELCELDGVSFNEKLRQEVLDANKDNESIYWMEDLIPNEKEFLKHVNYYHKNKLFKIKQNDSK